jgi:hypothetical protein
MDENSLRDEFYDYFGKTEKVEHVRIMIFSNLSLFEKCMNLSPNVYSTLVYYYGY